MFFSYYLFLLLHIKLVPPNRGGYRKQNQWLLRSKYLIIIYFVYSNFGILSVNNFARTTVKNNSPIASSFYVSRLFVELWIQLFLNRSALRCSPLKKYSKVYWQVSKVGAFNQHCKMEKYLITLLLKNFD